MFRFFTIFNKLLIQLWVFYVGFECFQCFIYTMLAISVEAFIKIF